MDATARARRRIARRWFAGKNAWSSADARGYWNKNVWRDENDNNDVATAGRGARHASPPPPARSGGTPRGPTAAHIRLPVRRSEH